MQTFVAFLRGINVGGHHKVPMKELKTLLQQHGFTDVQTLLNSGNVIFSTTMNAISEIESSLENILENEFGFPIPAVVRSSYDLKNLLAEEPFSGIRLTPDVRFYVSFLKDEPRISLTLPWISDDTSYQIISIKNKMIVSYLDLSKGKTVKGMDSLEKLFGKNLTTRNWNTIEKIGLMI